MKAHFGRQLKIQEAFKKTIEECINSLAEPTKTLLGKLLTSVCRVWNQFQRELMRIGSDEAQIPELNRKSPVYLCLPNEEVSPLIISLLRIVCAKQEKFLLQLSAYSEEFQKEKLPSVPVTQVEEQQLIGQNDLYSYLERLLFNIAFRNDYGQLEWDLEEVNKILLDLFRWRPLLSCQKGDIESIIFYFKAETMSGQPSIKLPDEVETQLNQLDSDTATLALKQLEVVLHLIEKLNPNQSDELSHFISSVIFERPVLPVFEKCQIFHAATIIERLKQHQEKDPFSAVPSDFRVPLENVSKLRFLTY